VKIIQEGEEGQSEGRIDETGKNDEKSEEAIMPSETNARSCFARFDPL
jgi:hypothetical protein